MDSHKVCRACLATKKEFYNLFTASTLEMFTVCTTIEVSMNDSLPKTLCITCFDLLNKLFSFKQQCIESNRTLQLIDIKTKLEAEVEIEKEDITIEIVDPFISDIKGKRGNINGTTVKTGFIDINSENSISNNINLSSKPDEDYNDSDFNHENDVVTEEDEITPKTKIKERKIIKHRKKLDHPCLQCKKKFPYPEQLEAHVKTHQGMEYEILCKICNKKFTQWHALRKHKEYVHMTAGKTLECPTCGKCYKTAITLHYHQKMKHQERKDFVCHICGGSYKSVSGFRNHIDTHRENRERKYECKICGKKLLSSGYLKTHMFIHKDRRFVCGTCSRPCSSKTNLATHMLTHSGIKPFLCGICNKSYATKMSFAEHSRIHSGERPFNCDHCSMGFVSKKRLTDHLRTHTGEKPYKCHRCNQGYQMRGGLKKHLRKCTRGDKIQEGLESV